PRLPVLRRLLSGGLRRRRDRAARAGGSASSGPGQGHGGGRGAAPPGRALRRAVGWGARVASPADVRRDPAAAAAASALGGTLHLPHLRRTPPDLSRLRARRRALPRGPQARRPQPLSPTPASGPRRAGPQGLPVGELDAVAGGIEQPAIVAHRIGLP